MTRVTIVTLLTDYGLQDTYVGQLKGALLTVAPDVTLVDLTHAVAPQDVLGGAFLLASAIDAFPARTIHVAVVDPGVGSARRALAIHTAHGDVLVGPDNGLLLAAAERRGGPNQLVELTNPAYWRPGPSTTFHGRDIFAPVAGHLANGVPLDILGSPIDPQDLVQLELPQPTGNRGQVVHVDGYGNLVTTLPASLVARASNASLLIVSHDTPETRRAADGRGDPFVAPLAPFYAAVAPGALLAVVGSSGLLEVSSRDGSAAALTGARRGTPIILQAG